MEQQAKHLGMEMLEQIAERLRTQDNRFTKDPIFQVRGLRRIYGMDPDYCEDPVWVDTEEWFEVDPPEDEDNPGEYLIKTGYMDVWEVLAVFFTEEGCNEHLRLMGHRYRQYREVDIYVDSLYRCPEMIAIREFLMALPGRELGYGDAVILAKGCTDYCGGYSGESLEAFQMGVQTVVNALEKAQTGWDTQTDAIWKVGTCVHSVIQDPWLP